jgi:hypothetical protein
MTSIADTLRIGDGRADGVLRRFRGLNIACGEDFFDGGNDAFQQTALPEHVTALEPDLTF